MAFIKSPRNGKIHKLQVVFKKYYSLCVESSPDFPGLPLFHALDFNIKSRLGEAFPNHRGKSVLLPPYPLTESEMTTI